MTPEEIAAEQELDLVSVKAILMQASSLYRKSCKVVEKHNFNEEERQMARDVISNIARFSDDERLQLKAAIYIRDDTEGRLDVVKQMAGLNINVLQFNSDMKKALAAVNRSKSITIADKPESVKQLENAST